MEFNFDTRSPFLLFLLAKSSTSIHLQLIDRNLYLEECATQQKSSHHHQEQVPIIWDTRSVADPKSLSGEFLPSMRLHIRGFKILIRYKNHTVPWF